MLPLASLLTGCAIETTAVPSLVHGSAISGVVHGGQQPVTGAKVYLLAANPAGYGSPSLSLLTSLDTLSTVDNIGAYTMTQPVNGGFSVAGDYSCTTGYAQGASTTSGGITLPGDEQIYLYVLGGDAGSGTNNNIGMLAALGPCNAQYASSGLVVNELTTVAAAYALAGYATDATHLSSSGSALARLGLANAGANSSNLVSLTTGLPVASVVVTGTRTLRPVAMLYTLADILAACVNGTTGNNSCGTVFAYTESAGASGAAPTDTATAAVNLAHHPYPTAAGMAALFGTVPSSGAPYAGQLSAQPNDFTVGISYDACALIEPSSLAIDASGNAWVPNGSSLCEFSSSGTVISGSSGYTGGGLSSSSGISIDTSGNVWVINSNNILSEFSNAGAPLSGSTGYGGGGLTDPLASAIDASGNVWVANYNSSLSEFSNSGTAVTGTSGYTGGGFRRAFSMAIDASGNVWVPNYFANSVSEFSNTGTPVSGTAGYAGGGLNAPYGIAIDASGNAWMSDNGGNSLSEFSSNGTPISGSNGYAGGGLNAPRGIAIDGSGNVWIANSVGNSVSAFSNSGSAISGSNGYTGGNYGFPGYTNGGFSTPYNVAIDASGDVWAVNSGTNSLTVLIGAAAPVVTPIAANLISPYGTAAVNKP